MIPIVNIGVTFSTGWVQEENLLTTTLGNAESNTQYRLISAPLLTLNKAPAGYLHHSCQLFCRGDRGEKAYLFIVSRRQDAFGSQAICTKSNHLRSEC